VEVALLRMKNKKDDAVSVTSTLEWEGGIKIIK
jgi:hypothetical protein